MDISLTGDFLKGPFLRTDLEFTETDTKKQGEDESALKYSLQTRVHVLNICEMIPVASFFAGGTRAMLGLAHAVYHTTHGLMSQGDLRTRHFEEALLGYYSFVRGLVAMVPLAGNLAIAVYDNCRVGQLVKERLGKFTERNLLPDLV